MKRKVESVIVTLIDQSQNPFKDILRCGYVSSIRAYVIEYMSEGYECQTIIPFEQIHVVEKYYEKEEEPETKKKTKKIKLKELADEPEDEENEEESDAVDTADDLERE